MEIIYEQRLDTITLKLIRNNITYGTKIKNGDSYFQEKNNSIGYVDWQTLLINNRTNDSILIDSYHADKNNTSWILGELNGESPINFYNIVNSYKKEKILYIIKYTMGIVSLDKYTFDFENKYQKEVYRLFIFPALTAFGEVYSLANVSEFLSETFFYLKVGTTLNSATERLYRQNSLSVYQYRFSKDIRRIEDKNKVFYSMDLNENKKIIEKLIQEISVEDDNIQYLGYLDDFSSYYCNLNSACRDDGLIYFFYKNNLNKIGIIRYDNYMNEWLIGDYEEIEIKSENII